MKNNKLPILIIVLVLLLLAFVFFDRIPLLGSGNLGIYPLLIFILAGLLIPIFSYFWGPNARFMEKQYYKNKLPDAKIWAKVLYFSGGGAYGNRGSGKSYLKFSDGREFSVWGSANPLSLAIKFRQTLGGSLEGEYKPNSQISEIVMNNISYQVNIDNTKKSLKYGMSLYDISVNPAGNQITFNASNWQANSTLWGNHLSKNSEAFAEINRVTNNYTEILFKNFPMTQEELFVVSFMVMSEKLVPAGM